MQQKTKIQLSQLEQQLMQNADWILTKNAVMEKMKQVLQECLNNQYEILEDHKIALPQEIFATSPKISKGENYKGLPWLVLDHPRHFQKLDVFAIRTLFWWGRYFSITLHLSGIYRAMFENKILTAYSLLRQQQFYCCINSNEWEHHLEKENYCKIDEMDEIEFKQIIIKRNFIKLSTKIELKEWQELPSHAALINKFLFEMLA